MRGKGAANGGMKPGFDPSPVINTGDRPGTGSGGSLLDTIGSLNQQFGQQQAMPQQAGPQGPQTPGMMPWGTPGAMPAGQGSTGPLAGMRPQYGQPQYNQPISNGGGMQSPYGGMPNMTQGYGQQGPQAPVNAYHQMMQQRLRRGGY